MSDLMPGISVILPSYNGIELLPRVLSSLAEQSLDSKLFEVVIVLNGPDDGSKSLIERFGLEHSKLELRVLQSAEHGASRARNIALSSVTREYVTFVDVDDALEPYFLQVALTLANPSTCALMPIVDILEGTRQKENSLNVRIMAYAGTTQLLRSIPWSLGFNACKIIPTRLLTAYRYPEHLKSGEDVAFFANLLRVPDLKVSVPNQTPDIAYLRHQRDDSVSRQAESFDFNVAQRLHCIAAIDAIDVHESVEKAKGSLVNAQFRFVSSYLQKFPGEVDDAIDLAISLKLTELDFAPLRQSKAKRLVISYCFPPYADTAGNVAAKQIAVEGELVDVLSANMERVRTKDASTKLIAAKYIAHHEELRVDPSFSSWPLIARFARTALRSATKLQKENGRYASLYSRALWSGSHVAAALVKIKFPNIGWEAEFSDPLRKGVNGADRPGRITWGPTTNALRKVVSNSPWSEIEMGTHFALTEAATMILADNLIFTNENQRKVMLEGYPESFQRMAVSKSTIRPHANPSSELFKLANAQHILDGTKINIGYFGNFYENRGIGPVLEALEQLPADVCRRFALHVFCNNPEKVRLLKITQGISAEVHTHHYLQYLEFLATLNKFDVLLVNDVEMTGSEFDVNPFLPSKYSDYAASDASIWGIVTAGSPLDGKPMQYRSYQSDHESITRELYKMLEELG